MINIILYVHPHDLSPRPLLDLLVRDLSHPASTPDMIEHEQKGWSEREGSGRQGVCGK